MVTRLSIKIEGVKKCATSRKNTFFTIAKYLVDQIAKEDGYYAINEGSYR